MCLISILQHRSVKSEGMIFGTMFWHIIFTFVGVFLFGFCPVTGCYICL